MKTPHNMVDADHYSQLLITPRAVPSEKVDQRVFNQFSERKRIQKTLTAPSTESFGSFSGSSIIVIQRIESDVIRRWRDQLIANKQKASDGRFQTHRDQVSVWLPEVGRTGSEESCVDEAGSAAPGLLGDSGKGTGAERTRNVLARPDQSSLGGARDYAILLLLFRSSLRVAEVCSLRASSIRWSHGRWVLRVKVKGGRKRSIPLPADVKKTIGHYLKLDKSRRYELDSGEPNSCLSSRSAITALWFSIRAIDDDGMEYREKMGRLCVGWQAVSARCAKNSDH